MPLTPAFTWKDQKDKVVVRILTKGCEIKKIDIDVTSKSLKVNMAPYLLDVILSHEINPIKHKASVKDLPPAADAPPEKTLVIELFKQNPQITWKSLELLTASSDILDTIDEEDPSAATTSKLSKEALKQMKKEAEEQRAALEKSLQEQRTDKRIENERFALRKQMSIDESERSHLEDLKKEEKRAAEAEVYEAFAKMNQKQDNQPQILKATKGVKFDLAESKETAKSSSSTAASTAQPISSAQAVDSNSTNSNNNNKSIFSDADIDAMINDCDIDEGQNDGANAQHHQYEHNASQVVEAPVQYIPAPRSAGVSVTETANIKIDFSARVFPTPLRESKVAEEEDWIAKNRRHLKKHGVLGKSLPTGSGNVTEEDPVWLKSKGDDFFRSGDHRSAVNAYSAAIDADDIMLPAEGTGASATDIYNSTCVACYSNRAACYLKLNQGADCVADCTKLVQYITTHKGAVLLPGMQELLVSGTSNASAATAKIDVAMMPTAITNTKLVTKLLIRKGAARMMIGQFTDAVSDYTTALTILQKIVPVMEKVVQSNQELEKLTVEIREVASDLERVRLLKDCSELKSSADKLVASNQFAAACELYDKALLLVPFHVGCISNRSACKLALGDIFGCVQDCTQALAIMEYDVQQANPGSSWSDSSSAGIVVGAKKINAQLLATILPIAGSEKRKLWVIKTIARRGAAYLQSGNKDAALEDYLIATKLDPNNQQLQDDLRKLQGLITNQ